MKTFLKVLLCVIAAIIVLKLMPFLLVPMLAGGFALMAGAAVILAVVLAIGGMGVAVLSALAIGLLALLAVASPLWIPVLLVVGLVALVCRMARA